MKQTRQKSDPFWRTKTLADLTRKEWESLCDGCGRCCLNKLEDEDTLEIFYTDAACKLLDHDTCRCKDYKNRTKFVSDCIVLSPSIIPEMTCLPPTCAYKLLFKGKDLFSWHPLISGDSQTVHTAGISVKGRVVNEELVKDLEDHIVKWPKKVPRGASDKGRKARS